MVAALAAAGNRFARARQRVGGATRAWAWGLAITVVVVLQAMLPAMHAAQHLAGATDRAMASAVETSVANADGHGHHSCGDEGAVHDSRDGGDDEGTGQKPVSPGDGCDVCKTLLLAKSLGGVMPLTGDAFTGEVVVIADAMGYARIAGERMEMPRDSRGPPTM